VVRLWRGRDSLWSAGLSADDYGTTPQRISSFVWWDLGGFDHRPEGERRGSSDNRQYASLLGGGWRRGSSHSTDIGAPEGRLLVHYGDEMVQQPWPRQPGRWSEVHQAFHETRLGDAPRPAPEEVDPLATLSRRMGVFLEQKEGDRQTYQYQTLWVDSRGERIVGVRREVHHLGMAGYRDWHVNHDRFYRWWNFPATSKNTFLVQRLDMSGNSRIQMQSELYDLESGQLLHAFPASGRILATTSSRRLAVVASKEKAGQAVLELWSLAESKLLGGLGTYGLGERSNSPVSVEFSSSGRWLVVERPKERKMEIWETNKLHKAATIDVPGSRPRLLFAPDEKRLLLVGPSYRGELPPVGKRIEVPFGRLIDPATGKTLCELKRLSDLGCFADDAFRFTAKGVLAVAVCPPGPVPFLLQLWDDKTGERTLLRHPIAATLPLDELGPRSALVQLGLAGKRVLLVSFWRGQTDRNERACIQLWDLERNKLLNQALEDNVGVHHLRLLADPNGILFAYGAHLDKSAREFIGWRWTNGVRITTKQLTLLAADESQRWTLWRGERGVFLYHAATNKFYSLEQTTGGYDYRAISPTERFVVLEEDRQVKDERGGKRSEYRSGLWDAQSGRCKVMFPPGHRFVSFDRTSKYAGTVDPAGSEVRIWSTVSGKEVYTLTGVSLPANPGPPRVQVHGHASQGWMDTVRIDPIGMVIHPSGRWLALLAQGVIQLWDLPGKKLLRTLAGPGQLTPIRCVAQHVGTQTVATGGDDGAVVLWDRKTGRSRSVLLGHTGAITALAFRRDGVFASASADGTIALWGPDGRRSWSHSAGTGQGHCRRLVFHPTSGMLAAGCGDGRVLLLDAGRRQVVKSATTDGSAVQALAFDTSGARLACGTARGRLGVYRSDDLVEAASWSVGTPVHALVFVPKTDLLAVGADAVRFWQVGEKREVLSVAVPSGPVRTLAMNAANELTVADGSTVLRVLDLAELRKQLHALRLDLP
jgi:WD40 repeat protein